MPPSLARRALLASLLATTLAPATTRAQEPAVVVVVERSEAAARMMEQPMDRILRAIREAAGPRTRVVTRASLGRRLAECDASEPSCAERVVAALGGARVLHLRLGTTRGACVPMRGSDGRRSGHRMLLALEIEGGPIGQPPSTREIAQSRADHETTLATAVRALLEG